MAAPPRTHSRITTVMMVLLLLSFFHFNIAQGMTIKQTIMAEVYSYRTRSGEMCVKPLSPDVGIQVRLSVRSTADNNLTFLAGSSIVPAGALKENNDYNFTFQHNEKDSKHCLETKMNNMALPYTSADNRFTTAFHFYQVEIFAAGYMELELGPCTQTTEDDSAVWVFGSAGPIPVLVLVVVVGVVLTITMMAAILYCKRHRGNMAVAQPVTTTIKRTIPFETTAKGEHRSSYIPTHEEEKKLPDPPRPSMTPQESPRPSKTPQEPPKPSKTPQEPPRPSKTPQEPPRPTTDTKVDIEPTTMDLNYGFNSQPVIQVEF